MGHNLIYIPRPDLSSHLLGYYALDIMMMTLLWYRKFTLSFFLPVLKCVPLSVPWLVTGTTILIAPASLPRLLSSFTSYLLVLLSLLLSISTVTTLVETYLPHHIIAVASEVRRLSNPSFHKATTVIKSEKLTICHSPIPKSCWLPITYSLKFKPISMVFSLFPSYLPNFIYCHPSTHTSANS